MPASLTNDTLSTTGETQLTISPPVRFSTYGTTFKGMQVGSKTLVGTSAQNYTVSITFPNTFTSVPYVFITGSYSNDSYAITMTTTNVSTTGFDCIIRFSNYFYNTGTLIINWLAINV